MTSVLLVLIGFLMLQSNDPIIRKQISTPEQTLKRITTEDGLPSNQTISIVQDFEGFMWIATRTGLARYDGVSFLNYYEKAGNPNSLSSSFIERVMTDDDGEIWVRTRDGVLHAYDRHNDDFIRFNETEFKSLLTPRDIYDVFGTSESGWWIGTLNGLYYLNPDKTELQYIESALNLGYVTGYYRKKDEQAIYFTSFRRGVFRFDMETGHITSLEKINRHLTMYATNHISRTREGHFLIIEHTTITIISKNGQLISSQNMGGGKIYHAITDLEYNTWFMHGYTIRRFDDKTGEAISYFTIQGALTMFVDRTQVLWIGTGGLNLYGFGLFLFDTKTMRFGFKEESFSEIVHTPLIEVLEHHNVGYQRGSDWAILSVRENSENATWFLTRRRGLFRYVQSTSELEHYPFLLEPNDPRTPQAYDFVLLGDQAAAVFTSRGVVNIHVHKDEVSLIDHSVLLPDFQNSETGIVINKMEKAAGFYWFATIDFGLFAYHPKTGETLSFTHDPTDRSTIGINEISSVSEDPLNPEKYIWVGTNLGGLNRIDLWENTILRIHEVSDFNAMQINSIHSDGDSGLWLTTEKGLFYFDVTTFTFIRYSGADGVQGTYNYFNRNQRLNRADGSLLICDYIGCNAFYPDTINPNKKMPSIGITNIKVMNESVLPFSSKWFTHNSDEPVSLQVRWNQNIIDIEFASLEYSSPKKNRHKYRLPPFIEDWIDIDLNRQITLTNLDPGSYKLEIIASNNDAVWASESRVMLIDVIPPFWMTLSFRLLIFFMLISAVGAVVWIVSNRKYKARLRELEYKMAVDNERLRISRDMHDNLGSRLTQIQLMSRSKARKKKGEVLEKTLEEISKETEGVIQNVSQIVWALNPENDTLENMVGFMIQYTETFCQRAGIACRINADDEFPNLSVTSDKRHHLIHVVKEAVNNAVKHASCSILKLNLHCKEQNNGLQLLISIEDNGAGFDPELVKSKKRNGLKSIKSRVESIGGEFYIDSSPGYGTRVHISYTV
ncbi:MAG: histidine kinase [Balneolales bacterium]|nr:histidine kinase [Balneolales bacterium]